ncbi:MAG: type II toxin-antitoxin system VapC family toxin [Acidobacteriia bacterium]|nr:type II toxin-antitoxin system VapC family toxin [Terriglobia bacterium]
MSGFLLDTNVPSELIRLRPEPRVAGWIEAANDAQLFVSVVTIGELRKGFTNLRESKRRAFLEDWLQNELLPWFEGRILPVTQAIASRWGILDGECQLRGTPLNTADGMIAATAIEHNLTVVTRNVKDFGGLGVTVFNPWEEPTAER